MNEYYWDNSATTQVCESAAEAMHQVMREAFGNPSSMHRKGVEAERLMKESRRTVAEAVGAKEKEILFTSGGTESNNLALSGLYHGNQRRGRHIISCQTEHPSVLNTLRHLEQQGAELTLLSPGKDGHVEPEAVRGALRQDTILVSLMHVNNETGAINPVEQIGTLVKGFRPETLFHVDAVQSFGKLPLAVGRMRVDALSVSGHKVHGPKGIGALYLREGVRCLPLFHGGGQESGLRCGTENLPGIVGLRAAVSAFDLSEATRSRLAERKRLTLEVLQRCNVPFEVNGDPDTGLANILNISFPGVKSEVLLHTLESKGIYLSSGSACSSKKKAYSPVLTAMNLPEARLDSAVRISLSSWNLEEDPMPALEAMAAAVLELKSIMDRRKTWKR